MFFKVSAGRAREQGKNYMSFTGFLLVSKSCTTMEEMSTEGSELPVSGCIHAKIES